MERSPTYRSSVPVIAVGNFTVGGAGKTPTTMALAHLATELGFSPIVLMRGYGGSATAPTLVDGAHDRASDVGDEALMIARTGQPVIVSKQRVAGADLATACGGDLIILDDGFQSPALAKDLSIVVVDSVYGVGNGRVLPAGPLRAPLDRQLARADAIVVISNGAGGGAADAIIKRARSAHTPVLTAQILPDGDASRFAGKRMIAFAGIGRPQKLAEGLAAGGAVVEGMVGFPDHHFYTPGDARALLNRVMGTDLILVTTAKDMARLGGTGNADLDELARKAVVAEVKLVFDQPDQVTALLSTRLGKPRPSGTVAV